MKKIAVKPLSLFLYAQIVCLFTQTAVAMYDGDTRAAVIETFEKTEQVYVKDAFDIARNGTRAAWEKSGKGTTENVSYSWKYISRQDLLRLIGDCDQKALASYHKNDLPAAIDRLYTGLSCAAEFGDAAQSHWGKAVSINQDQAPPLVWLDVFKALDTPNLKPGEEQYAFPKSKYIPAVNNYAYYLRLQGKYKETIPIFEKIIAIDPSRIVTNLDLADAYWESGDKEKSRPLYAKYLTMMQKAHFKNVPPRVPERAQR